MAKCFRCGTETAVAWRFCSKRREFVCITCEKACPEYSGKLLPNGTNCKLTYIPDDFYRYLHNTKEYEKFVEKYAGFNLEQLRGRFLSVKESYKRSDNGSTKHLMRAELTALKDLIEKAKLHATEHFNEKQRAEADAEEKPKKGKKEKSEAESREAKKSDSNETVYKEIINYLNEKIGTGYSPKTEKTRRSIKARLNEGNSVEDFKTVIDKKVEEWIGTEFEKYLRPETLFGTKFESYLNARVTVKVEDEPKTTSYNLDDYERYMEERCG